MQKIIHLFLFIISSGMTTAFAMDAQKSVGQVRVDTARYSCSEVVGILREHRSIWVKGFLGTYGNVAATAGEISHCNGPQSGRRHCNIWTPDLRTKDGACRVGVRCTCFSDERGRDN